MLTFDEARKLYEKFKRKELPRLQLLHDYFVGKHEILNKKDRDDKGEKKDTKAVNNYARYISTMSTGYFMGNPVSYTSAEKEVFDKAAEILEWNDEETVNYNLALSCSIYGKAYELCYLDDKGEFNFVDLDPRNVIVLTDGKVKPTITEAIVFSESPLKDDKLEIRMDLYDEREVKRYTYIAHTDVASKDYESYAYAEGQSKAHNFKTLPIIEYKNNEFELGDFESVMSLIDSYNQAVSASVDDLRDFTDAFLVLKNMSGTNQDDVDDMKKNKILLLDDDGEAEWLIKSVNDSYSSSIKDRLKEDIHKFSFVPDMTDQNFGGNLSGVAIKYKLLALEQVRGQKARMFKRGLLERLWHLANYMQMTGSGTFNQLAVKVHFTENVPQNLMELSQMIEKLVGVVSNQTLLSQLPFVQDAKQEQETLEEEQRNAIQPLDYNLGGENSNGERLLDTKGRTEG
ncbi:phage portal protein [Brevibacillus laterosporus]|uniref:phage portal protein n=1 Tax=Brevibacillus laterosporus TaxID=1465 RepID=UPI000BC9D844|nr:phage portal protein [Brevibacillus laterosporus]PCN42279.1 phage portal protein [Brevibacillus laterosporus]